MLDDAAPLRIDSETKMLLLDRLAQLFPGSSRTTLRQMLQHGRVRVNGEVEKDAKRNVAGGDAIDVMDKRTARPLPPEHTLLHQYPNALAVLKANGLFSHK